MLKEGLVSQMKCRRAYLTLVRRSLVLRDEGGDRAYLESSLTRKVRRIGYDNL